MAAAVTSYSCEVTIKFTMNKRHPTSNQTEKKNIAVS
jgi:hypothetical protein